MKIEREFDFHRWCRMWQGSGKWDFRGSRVGQYVMSRYGDVGPCSPENCLIQLGFANLSEGTWNCPNPEPAISARARNTQTK